ncbi:MAG: hypothetical protein GQ583_11835 [Methyloprofundus sp.]|nr:hypothetical protein [Methyloprofundus sp.]
MPEIIAILEALSPSSSTNSLKQLGLMIESTLSMTGHVTKPDKKTHGLGIFH